MKRGHGVADLRWSDAFALRRVGMDLSAAEQLQQRVVHGPYPVFVSGLPLQIDLFVLAVAELIAYHDGCPAQWVTQSGRFPGTEKCSDQAPVSGNDGLEGAL
jgi:hypothetical protein